MRHTQVHHFATALRIVVVTAALAGCATTRQETLTGPPPEWPSPPAQARIRFVSSVSESPGFESRGFFASALDLIFGSRNRDLPRLAKPSALAVDTGGTVYVSDLAEPAVFRIPRDGSPWKRMTESIAGQLQTPVGVALGGDTLFIVDASTAKIFVLDAQGRLVRTIATGMQRPTSIVVDNGRLYVTDSKRCEVLVMDPAGNRILTFGVGDTGVRALHTPTNIAIDRDTLFIVDALNFRVAAFTTSGVFVRSFGIHGDIPGLMSRPRGIAFDPDGNLYVVDALLDCVQIFSRTGTYLLSFGDEGARDAGKFDLPAGISIGRDNRIYVADSYNSRVQVFQYLR